jgi:hypothetical protein
MVVMMVATMPVLEFVVGHRVVGRAGVRMGMHVLMVMAMTMRALGIPPEKKEAPEAGNGQSREDAKPGVESLGHDVSRRIERDPTEQIHTSRV